MSTSTPDLRFPDERPLRSDELEQLDARRLEPVIQTLAQGLRSYWNHYGESRDDLARVWGVHGALGQGKSTVIQAVVRLLKNPATPLVLPLVHGWNWIRWFTQRYGHRRELQVSTLEASQFKAEHLSTTLISRLLLPRFVLSALPMLVLNLLVLFSLLWGLLNWLGYTDWLFSPNGIVRLVVAVLALPLFATIMALVTAWSSSEYSAGHLEQAIYQLARWTGVAPDLVVLDDLDRATVDQQRAVLRTLVRHTRLLQCPLVVCFDETDFLASDPNPEDPAELLRKLIQVPLRLPPRSREDAVLLAWGAAKVWLQRNPDRQTWATFLLHPVWIGHLTRVMLLTESVGPRRAKGLLADVVAAAETHYPLQPHPQVPLAEANALLLLSALYQMHPALRRDAEWLVNCLESGGDDDAWKHWSETPRSKAFFKWISTHPREEAQIRSLLKLADAMMPVSKGWRGVVFAGNPLEPQALPDDGLALDYRMLDRMLQQDLAVYPRWIEAGRALDRIAQGIRGTEGLSTVVSSWRLSDADGTTHRDTPHAHETDTPVFAAIWPMLIASLAQWPEHQRLQVYSAVSRWLQREARHTRTLQQHWLLEWAMDRTHAGRGSDDFWLKQIEPGSADGPTDPASVIRLATLKALRRHRKPSQRFGQQSWRAALGLADSAGLAVDPGLMAAAITQNGEIPPHRTTDGSRSNSAALRYWPAVQAPAGTEPSPPVMQEVLGEHMRAARTWLTGSTTPLGGLAAERDADGGPQSLIQWMASHDAERLHLQHWLKALAPLCAPSPDPLPSEWSFAHWSAHFVYHAPTAMGTDKLGEQLAALEELDSEGWAVALCLLTQGWHRELSDLHRLQLGQALIGRMPPPPAVPFALGALSAWLPPADMLKTPSSPENQIEHVYFQALPMVPEDAIKLIKWLLDAINPGDGGGADGIPTSTVTQFFQSWAQVKPPEALNFYRLAKEHWDLRIQDSSGGNLPHRDDQYGSPDNLF